MTMSGSYPTDPYQHRPALSRRFLPLALITLGVVFLLGNLVPQGPRPGLILVGLGAAFLIGRITTGRYGYAVPAGLLLALGAHLILQDTQGPRLVQGGGWFFVLLGLGFALVYVIGLRPAAVWPLFPATVFLGLAVVLFGVASFGALAAMSWIVGYWPMALVLLGLWLLFRDHLAPPLRRPIATLGGLALLGYGILAAAATVAAGGALARPDLASGFGTPAFAKTITLDQPIAAGQTFNVDNPSGHTTLRAGTGPTAHVVATAHFDGQEPDVRLTPDGGGLTLSAANTGRQFPFGGSRSWVDYVIEVPAAVQVQANSNSGQIEVDGVAGAVQAETSSGAVRLTNLAGAARAHSASGSIELSNVAGDITVSTNSGQIRATEARHLREATSSSGSISLEGVFSDAAKIQSNSGSVNIKLLPGSAVQLDATSGSGSINPQNLVNLQGGSTQRNRLTGAIGAPAAGAVLSIETNSGSVQISQ